MIAQTAETVRVFMRDSKYPYDKRKVLPEFEVSSEIKIRGNKNSRQRNDKN